MSDVLTVKNPATGKILAEIERDSPEMIEDKLKKGDAAFSTWKKTDAHHRSHLLKKWAELIQKNRESIAIVMTEENGKPLSESRGEVDYATSYIDWFAEEAKR